MVVRPGTVLGVELRCVLFDQMAVKGKRIEDGSSDSVFGGQALTTRYPNAATQSVCTLFDQDDSWDVYHLEIAVEFQLEAADACDEFV